MFEMGEKWIFKSSLTHFLYVFLAYLYGQQIMQVDVAHAYLSSLPQFFSIKPAPLVAAFSTTTSALP